jgi:hypothetical protein
MTQENNNLKIWRDAISAGPACISLDKLHQLLKGAGPQEDDLRHMDGCPHCQASLAMLRSFESAKAHGRDAADVAWIVARLQGQSAPAPALPPRVRFFKLPYLVGALAATLAVGLGISMLVNRSDQPSAIVAPSGVQTMRSGSVHLYSPSGNVTQPPVNFQWEVLPGAALYSVQLMEIDGSILWSGSSSQNALPVTAELTAAMQPGKPLLWRVVALDSSGKTMASSNQERFVIEAPHGERR